MPYIEQDKREDMDEYVDSLADHIDSLPKEDKDGALNYAITKLLKNIYSKKYFDLNRAMGVLSSVTHEFYRRVVSPYEDKKIEENGDVE